MKYLVKYRAVVIGTLSALALLVAALAAGTASASAAGTVPPWNVSWYKPVTASTTTVGDATYREVVHVSAGSTDGTRILLSNKYGNNQIDPPLRYNSEHPNDAGYRKIAGVVAPRVG